VTSVRISADLTLTVSLVRWVTFDGDLVTGRGSIVDGCAQSLVWQLDAMETRSAERSTSASDPSIADTVMRQGHGSAVERDAATAPVPTASSLTASMRDSHQPPLAGSGQTQCSDEKLRSDEKHKSGHDARCAERTGSAASQLTISVTEPHSFMYAKAEQYGSGRGGYRLPPEPGGSLQRMDRRYPASQGQSDRLIMRRIVWAAGAALAAACLGWAGWQLVRMSKCWGATASERVRELPGDDLLFQGSSTMYAITIAVPPQQVWPWLVQIGRGRGGFTPTPPSSGCLVPTSSILIELIPRCRR
jgi:hypothetical protein